MYNEYIYKFIKSKGFDRIREDKSSFFGDNYQVFANESFQLRFSSSKSFEAIDIRSNSDEDWYDLALVKALLYGEKKLNNATNIGEYKSFLLQEFANITKLFTDLNYPVTKKKLEDLGNERAKQMFPGMGS